MKELAQKITKKNRGMEITEVLTNSAEFGIVRQQEFFDKKVASSENLDRYYVLDNFDFVYNPRISESAPVGPININKTGKKGVISPLYTVFRNFSLDNEYLEWYFKSPHWHSFMKLNGDSGARSDRFSIKDSVFFTMPISFPSMEEQKKIRLLFRQIDRTITLQQRLLFR